MSRRCCARNCFNTIITNKNVEYFGFPKSEEFAHKWALAAGRDDLLDKPLNNLIKYYLCSNHFTDDCFIDNNRTKLIKQSRPRVVVPIPSIFENNINEFIPESLKECAYFDVSERLPSPSKRKMSDTYEIEEVLPNKHRINGEHKQSSSDDEKQIHVYIVPPDPSVDEGQSFIVDDGEDIVSQPFNQCRLCANTFKDPEQALLPIFNTDEMIAESIDRLLPETIFLDDRKPQHICWTCYHKMNQCIDIIDSFNIAQAKFD